MANLQQAALAQAEALLLDSVSISTRDGTTSASLLTQAEAFEQAAASIKRRFKSIAAVFRRDHNSQQRVNRLPAELLVSIFEWCLDVNYNDEHRQDATNLHRICAVCGHWKDLAEGSPILWRYVSGLDPLQHVEKALKLSEPMPITVVYLHDSTSRISESVFTAAVNPHAPRWSRATFTHENLDKDPQAWEWSELSKLHTLDIYSNSFEHTRTQLRLGRGQELPNLRVIKLLDIPLRWDPEQLPGLRILDLTGYESPATAPTTSQLLRLLKSTLRLESLSLYEVKMHADGGVQLSVILPNLTNLQLSGVPLDAIQQLLSSIQLPQCNRKHVDRDSTHHLPSNEHLNSSNDAPHQESNLDVFGFDNYRTHFSRGNFEVSISPTFGEDGLECMGMVLGKFSTELTASQGIQAKIGIPDGLGPSAIARALDALDRFPNLRALWIVESIISNRIDTLLTLIRQLGRPKDLMDSGVWYFPHLESISVDTKQPPFRELGEVCRERREAAGTSGCPKAIKELRIFPLNKYFVLESKPRLDQEMEGNLDRLQDALGEGQLFWGSELWKRSLDRQVPESTSSLN